MLINMHTCFRIPYTSKLAVAVCDISQYMYNTVIKISKPSEPPMKPWSKRNIQISAHAAALSTHQIVLILGTSVAII
jgi:hypothetical protein